MTDFVVADCGIRQLHARFVDAVWRQNYTAFADCFAIDGEWKIAGLHLRGRDAIKETAGKLLGRCERIQLVVGQPILQVGDGTAIGRLQVTEFAKKNDGTTALTFGTYYDRYVEDGDTWRFRWRHWAMAYHGPVDMSAPYIVPPDYGPFPAMPASDEPTYVRKA